MRKAPTLRTLCAALMVVAIPAAAQDSAPPSSTTSSPTTPSPAAVQSATIVDIAAGNAGFSALAAAIQAADLAGTLASAGPFTVFAPTNSAFDKLPTGLLTKLTAPANKSALAALLTYHVVAGRVSAADLVAAIQTGGGKAVLTTVNGATLTATFDGTAVVLTDAKGGKARVIATDIAASNGIIHPIDAVVMP